MQLPVLNLTTLFYLTVHTFTTWLHWPVLNCTTTLHSNVLTLTILLQRTIIISTILLNYFQLYHFFVLNCFPMYYSIALNYYQLYYNIAQYSYELYYFSVFITFIVQFYCTKLFLPYTTILLWIVHNWSSSFNWNFPSCSTLLQCTVLHCTTVLNLNGTIITTPLYWLFERLLLYCIKLFFTALPHFTEL